MPKLSKEGRDYAPKIAITGQKKNPMTDKRISVCTDCRYGIFTHSTYLWTKRGYVHQACEDKRLLDETEIIT